MEGDAPWDATRHHVEVAYVTEPIRNHVQTRASVDLFLLLLWRLVAAFNDALVIECTARGVGFESRL